MLKYQTLGPDENDQYTVVAIYPHDNQYGPASGVYCVVSKATTIDNAKLLCDRYNAPPCERTLMLRAKVAESNARKLVRDIPEDEKKRRGIK